MASVLQVATIKDQGGNANAIEIANSSANVTINNLAAGTIGSAVTGLTGIKVVDTWRLTSSFSGEANPITSNLARVTSEWAVGAIGSAMTESSGIFTFPMTGIYLVEFHSNHSLNGYLQHGATYINSVISGTSSLIARNYLFIYKYNGTTYTNSYLSCMFDCTDTSTHKVSFSIADLSNTSLNTNSSGVMDYTTMRFYRLGDT